jgi:protein-S-isoprenylcysteine O-methyltransferase Ste14
VESIYRLIFYVFVMLAGRFFSQRQRHTDRSLVFQSQAIAKDWTALLTALSTAVAIALPVLEASLRGNNITNVWAAMAGIAMILAGWGVAYLANRAIGASWSATIDKTQEQRLATSGMYSVVRHPLYLSGLCILAGTNIYFGSSWAWLGALAALIIISVRVPIEERLLLERFGQEYIDYQKRTKAILPWIF